MKTFFLSLVKTFFLSLVFALLIGAAIGVRSYSTAAILLVGACLVYVCVRLSGQLENLYILLALKRVPNSKSESGVSWNAPSVDDFSHHEKLPAWERQTYLHFLAKGMSVKDASDATSLLQFKNRRMIAIMAPQRVVNGCNDKNGTQLCPACSKALADVTQQLEMLRNSKEKPNGWLVFESRCPVPRMSIEEILSSTDDFLYPNHKQPDC